MLDINKSRYVDFQKVRIQETQAELPRGSIPRRFVDMIKKISIIIQNSDVTVVSAILPVRVLYASLFRP